MHLTDDSKIKFPVYALMIMSLNKSCTVLHFYGSSAIVIVGFVFSMVVQLNKQVYITWRLEPVSLIISIQRGVWTTYRTVFVPCNVSWDDIN